MRMRMLVLTLAGAAPLVPLACAVDGGGHEFGPDFGAPEGGGEGGGPGQGEGGGADGGGPGTDGGADDAPPTEGGSSCATPGTIAVLAGDDSALTGVFSVDGAAWTGGTIAGGATKSLPALVAFGGGFLGLARGTGDTLQSLTAAGGATTFSAPQAVVASGVKDAPALTVVGTTAHLVWIGGATTNRLLWHRSNDGTGFGATDDPVGSPQDFSNAAATLAPLGTSLALGEDGTDMGLYTRTLAAGTWAPSAAIGGVNPPGTYQDTVPPAMVSVTGGLDLVLLYADATSSHVIGYATHAAGGAWSTAKSMSPAETSHPMALAAISATKLLLAFQGNDNKLYTSTGTVGAADVSWSAPAAVPGVTSLDGPPAVAKGVCGADAVVVFSAAGVVSSVTLAGGTFGAASAVTGGSGARIAVATR